MLCFGAQAAPRIVHVSNVTELIAAIGDVGNPDFGDIDEVNILLAPGEYQLTEFLGSGLALPELTTSGIDVTIKPADTLSLVTLIGGGPGSNFGLIGFRPSDVTSSSYLSIKNITIRDFHTEGNGAVMSVDTAEHAFAGAFTRFRLADCLVMNVAASNGGVVHVSGQDGATSIRLDRCRVDGAVATGNGGVAHQTIGGGISLFDNDVSNASAGNRGGVVYAKGANSAQVAGNTIRTSHATSQLGSHFYINGQSINVTGNEFNINPDSQDDKLVSVGGGPDNAHVAVSNNTFINVPTGGAAIVDLGGTLIGADVTFWLNAVETQKGGQCTDHPFASTELNLISLGGNGTNDLNCTAFDHPGDIIAPDLLIRKTPPDFGLLDPISPLVDVSAFDTCPAARTSSLHDVGNLPKPQACNPPGQPGVLPCGYKDIRGLARPQDGDLDGVFSCDAGAYEVQGGADIGAPQSGAYFDIAHDQEGYFAEVLDGGHVVISVFTYKRDGTGAAWYTGLGNVVGNSFVVDDMLLSKGGVFGAGFDANNITRTAVAGFSANFPDCQSTTTPGRWVIDPVDNISFSDPQGSVSDAELDTLLEEQIQVSTRLSQIVDCGAGNPAVLTTGTQARLQLQSENAYRSGNYFDPARSGEGILVEVLTDGSIIVIWYTFDPQGNPMWILASGTLTGNSVTLDARYPTAFTHFGSTFDTSEIVLSNWGTLTLEFITCNSLRFSYNSTIAEYGSGNHNYVRLTKLAGLNCPAL